MITLAENPILKSAGSSLFLLCFLIAFVRLLWLRKMPKACFTASNSHFDHGGGDASDMTAWSAICLSVCRAAVGLSGLGWRDFAPRPDKG